MVGVPAFSRCAGGPSSRTTSPQSRRSSQPMTSGPTTKVVRRAVTIAPAARKEMYWNRLKTMCSSARGKSR